VTAAADGQGINELARVPRPPRPRLTLRVYGHTQQGRHEHARSIIGARMNRLSSYLGTPDHIPGADKLISGITFRSCAIAKC